MNTPLRRRNPFLFVTALCALALGALWGVWLLAGDALVRAATQGRSQADWTSWFVPEPQLGFEASLARANERFYGFIALLIAAWALFAVIVLARRGRYWLARLALLLAAWWLAFELLAAPALAELFDLKAYRLVNDVENLPKHHTSEFNSDMLRSTAEPESFTEAGYNIVFLGDSFAYGAGVGGHQAYPHVVEKLLRERWPQVEVANFAWMHASPFVAYRRLVRLGERYRPDLVVYCVDMSDFADDLAFEAITEQRGLYALYDKLPITIELLRKYAPRKMARALVRSTGTPAQRYFACEHPLDETRADLEHLGRNLARIDEWCRAHGAAFAAVFIPRNFQVSAFESPKNRELDGNVSVLGPYSLEPFRWAQEHAERSSYPVISLLEDFQRNKVFPLCFDDNPHWRVSGHQFVARALAPRLSELFLDDKVPGVQKPN
jgi:hypothetical protein